MLTEKFAFCMFLNPGCEAEYQRRHDEIWPEMVPLLKDAGISDYSIYLEAANLVLFAVLRRSPDHTMDRLPEHPVMQRRWAHMADLMVTNADGSPKIVSLLPMFYLP
jgi:L-rhamnose mutarotase